MMNNITNPFFYNVNIGNNDITLANEGNRKNNELKRMGTVNSLQSMPMISNGNENVYGYSMPKDYMARNIICFKIYYFF